MSQHDFDIANQTASTARADINLGLKALASLSSGAVAPTTTYANMLWYDTSTNILKIRNEADAAWINVGYVDQSGGVYSILDDTKVVTSAGTQTGLLGDQTTAIWQVGTGTTESLVSPAKVKAAIAALTLPSYDATGSFPAAGAATTSTHGLGVKPSRIQVTAQCTAANNGYSIGDEVLLASDDSQARGKSVFFDSTLVGFSRIGSAFFVSKDGTTQPTFSASQWQIRFRAWV